MKKEDILERIISMGKTSKITHWEVENFAQYPSARWDFDEDGIIVFKAKNSVGKSMGLKALRAALTTAWVASGKARRLIRHMHTECVIRVFFDDGVEIEYVMKLSSLAPKARFTNGYHLYYHQNEKRVEVYNTLKDGRYVTVRETPIPIKRYLNLAEMDGKYTNIMSKSEGLMALDQTPKALMKSLSKVADLETAERAITKINKDNKETLQELRAGDTRVRMFSNEIEERGHLTKEVMGILLDSNKDLELLEGYFGELSVVKESLSALSGVKVMPSLQPLSLGGLETSVQVLNLLQDLNNQRLIKQLDTVDFKLLEKLNSLNLEISAISDIEFLPFELQPISVSNLGQFASISKLLSELKGLTSSFTTSLKPVSVKELTLGKSTFDLIENYEQEHQLFLKRDEDKLIEIERATAILRELQAEGYPVSKCSACGELTISTEIGEQDLATSTLHSH